jgi:Uma2 family endonuclease
MRAAAIPKSLHFPDIDKPYVESIHGRLEPKVSAKRIHGRLELRIGRLLDDWAGERGEVAIEWRFYLLTGAARPSSLVPDVAYVSYERLPLELPSDARERPRLAPDIAVEILSPGDKRATLEEKVELYHAHGSRAIAIVNPKQTMVELRYSDGMAVVAATGVLQVSGFAGLEINVDRLFAGL